MAKLNDNDLFFLWARVNEFWLPQEGGAPDGTLSTVPVPMVPERPQANSLRDVSGLNNNPLADRAYYGAADTFFRRIDNPIFRDAEGELVIGGDPSRPNSPGSNDIPTSYGDRGIDLVDSEPRKISNFISDQSDFAMSVIGYVTPAEQTVALLDNPEGRGAPLTGIINPLPYSSWTTLFGQFFDHGLDFVHKGADGIVLVPLKPGDPLYEVDSRTNFMIAARTDTARIKIGEGSTDSLVETLFDGVTEFPGQGGTTWDQLTTNPLTGGSFVGTLDLTGAIIEIEAADAQGVADAINGAWDVTGLVAVVNDDNSLTIGTGTRVTDDDNNDVITTTYTLNPAESHSFNTVSPFIDLSQSYGSSESRKVFLKEYDEDGLATGRLAAGGPDRDGDGDADGLATWADIKENALKIGLTLRDYNVLDVPQVEKVGDGYYSFVALEKETGVKYLIQDTAQDFLDANNLALVTTGHAFLDDLAHGVLEQMNAQGDVDPAATTTYLSPVYADDGSVTYEDTPTSVSVLLDGHYVAGDGRSNENIGLTAIHQVFHTEHDRLVSVLLDKLGWPTDEKGNPIGATHMWTDPDTGTEREWTRDGLFEAAKLVNEMEYQHMVFDEFARKISNNVANFRAYDINVDAAITAEFAHTVYRFGHSMLTDEVGLLDLDENGIPNGTDKSIGLIEAFLNPLIYDDNTASEVAYGMSSQVGSGIDIWVADALRNNLVGLPLDLATLNLVRGRDTGMGTLNQARESFVATIEDLIANAQDAIATAVEDVLGLEDVTTLEALTAQQLIQLEAGIGGEALALLEANAEQLLVLEGMLATLAPYATWTEFAANFMHPEVLENFILAYTDTDYLVQQYGDQNAALTQAEIDAGRTYSDSLVGDVNDQAVLDLLDAAGASAELRAKAGYDDMPAAVKVAYDDTIVIRALAREAMVDPAFMDAVDGEPAAALNAVDFWIGGLAEMPVGGMLGSTFDFVFATQMMDLQNGDLFYYLDRVADADFFAEIIESQTFATIVMRSTGADHIYPDIFTVPDAYVEMTHQDGVTFNTFAELEAETTNQEVIVITPPVLDVDGVTVLVPEIVEAANRDLGRAGLVENSADPRPEFNGQQVFYGNPGDYIDGRGVFSPNGTGNASEVIGGTAGDDRIDGLGGNDAIYGDAGRDTIEGNNGNDFLFGGQDNDLLIDTGFDADPLTGQIFGSDDIIDGGAGNDVIFAGAGFDVLRGGDDDDIIHGELDGDDINAGNGNDIVFGGDGGRNFPDLAVVAVNGALPFALEDIIAGGAGNDSLFGGYGWDRLDGGDDDDVLVGGRGTSRDDFLPDGSIDVGIDRRLEALVDSFATNANLDPADITLAVDALGLTPEGVASVIMPRERHDGQGGSDIYLFYGKDTPNDLEPGIDAIGGDRLLSDYDYFAEDVADSGLGANDVDEIRFAATTDQKFLLNGGTFGIERVVIGTGDNQDADTSGTADVDVNALMLTEDLTLVGNEGDNVLIGANTQAPLFDPITGLQIVFEAVNGVSTGVQITDPAELAAAIATGITDGTAVPLLGPQPMNAIYGNGGNDRITGGDVEDTIEGGDGNDIINAGDGADILTGGAGSDQIDGGLGVDTAYYSGVRCDYAIGYDANNDRFYILDMREGSPDGRDVVTNVENIIFGDRLYTDEECKKAVEASVSIETVSQAEGNSGVTEYTLTIQLDGALVLATEIDWSISGGLADAGDFAGQVTSGTVVLDPGQTTATFTVNVAGDLEIEGDESFTVALSNPRLVMPENSDNPIDATIATYQNIVLSAQNTVQAVIENDDLPVINGTAEQDKFLWIDTAAATTLVRDGMTFQWMRDGDPIEDATSASYRLTQDDVGHQITLALNVSYPNGYVATVVSKPTIPVANANDAPTGNVLVMGSAQQGETLSADTSELADLDGLGKLSYQWLSDGAPIEGANSKSYVLDQDDVGHEISVRVSYTDGFGNDESVTSTATQSVEAMDGVAITGVVAQGELLSVDSGDLGDGERTYQWLRDGVAIEGATDEDYLLTSKDVGGQISVRVTSTDSEGVKQTVSSDSTDPVSSVIVGTPERDVLVGTQYADTIQGLGANDDITGGASDDVIDGGPGVDTANYSGSQAHYTLELSASGVTITDRREDGNGTDELSNIETLDFDVEVFDFAPNDFNLTWFDSAADVSPSDFMDFVEFYIAYFNRAPDAVGLLFWADAYAEGTSLEDMAALFIDQEETAATYPEGMSNEDFATAVYDNVLGRVPDQAGFDFWVDMLDRSEETGVTRDQFILEVLRGVRDGSPDRAYLDSKVDIGTYFAVTKGMSDVDNASAVMELYDGTEGSIADAVAAIDAYYVSALDAENGEFLMPLVGVVDSPFMV